MTKKQKKLIGIISAIALCLGIIPAADAMHTVSYTHLTLPTT
mgnify:CR=1 FL=1